MVGLGQFSKGEVCALLQEQAQGDAAGGEGENEAPAIQIARCESCEVLEAKELPFYVLADVVIVGVEKLKSNN